MSDPNNAYNDTDPAFAYRPANDGICTAGTWHGPSSGQGGTLHVNNDLAAKATFTFPVAAIGFSYFGILRSHGGRCGICIDCSPGAPNYIPVDAFNATASGASLPVRTAILVFTASLAARIRLIVLDFAGPSVPAFLRRAEDTPDYHPEHARPAPAGNSQLTINRIELYVPLSTATAFTSYSVGVFMTSSISSAPIASSTSTPTLSSTPASFTKPSRPTVASLANPALRAAAIVCIILGALVLICGIFVLICWHRHRRCSTPRTWATPFILPWGRNNGPALLAPSKLKVGVVGVATRTGKGVAATGAKAALHPPAQLSNRPSKAVVTSPTPSEGLSNATVPPPYNGVP